MGKNSDDQPMSEEEFKAGLNPFGGSGSYNPDARLTAVGRGRRREKRSG